MFFCFKSITRHTRWPRDWSSDVCSSDLLLVGVGVVDVGPAHPVGVAGGIEHRTGGISELGGVVHRLRDVVELGEAVVADLMGLVQGAPADDRGMVDVARDGLDPLPDEGGGGLL